MLDARCWMLDKEKEGFFKSSSIPAGQRLKLG
jgi:hypothetical protein